MKNYEVQLIEILEGVFKHGMETPDKAYDLPEGQLTIAEALNKSKSLIRTITEEVIGEDKDSYEVVFSESKMIGRDKKTGEEVVLRMMNKENDENSLRSEQRTRLDTLLGGKW